MLNIQLLREDITAIKNHLKTRGYDLDIDYFEKMESKRKQLQMITENLQAQRNSISKLIGHEKKTGKDTTSLIQQVNEIAEKLTQTEKEYATVQDELNNWLLKMPNIPHPDVPVGRDETQNEEVKRVGQIREFDFVPLDHVDLGEKFGLETGLGVKLSGSRFSFLKGQIAKLHRAIAQFMLDTHTTRHHYTECYTPYIVNPEILVGTSQLPKFEEDMYKVQCGGDENTKEQYLISTAEISLTNIVRENITKLEELPIKITAHSPCFRSEAGSYGKDTKGLIRVHQFDKVELVQIVEPKNSYAALEELVSHAEYILEALELPYRVITLCTGDMGFSAAKTYDIEVWMPSQNTYREISSCSNCEEFQARRMKARYKDKNGKNQYLHTLNGSGLAVGRTLAAIIENYQDKAGNITIPHALRPYFNGQEIIKK